LDRTSLESGEGDFVPESIISKMLRSRESWESVRCFARKVLTEKKVNLEVTEGI
jgi:hypothetical protein